MSTACRPAPGAQLACQKLRFAEREALARLTKPRTKGRAEGEIGLHIPDVITRVITVFWRRTGQFSVDWRGSSWFRAASSDPVHRYYPTSLIKKIVLPISLDKPKFLSYGLTASF